MSYHIGHQPDNAEGLYEAKPRHERAEGRVVVQDQHREEGHAEGAEEHAQLTSATSGTSVTRRLTRPADVDTVYQARIVPTMRAAAHQRGPAQRATANAAAAPSMATSTNGARPLGTTASASTMRPEPTMVIAVRRAAPANRSVTPEPMPIISEILPAHQRATPVCNPQGCPLGAFVPL